jgi:hypothetical protein
MKGYIDNYIEYLLKEGLIKTYDLNYLLDYLFQTLHSLKITEFSIDVRGNTLKILFHKNLDLEFVKWFITTLNTFGYFLSFVYLENNLGLNGFGFDEFEKEYLNEKIIKYKEIHFVVEPKFDEKAENIGTVYHLTKKDNLEKIEEIGLVPKNKNRKSYHPERIYLSLTLDDSKMVSISMNPYYNKKKQIILEINLKDLYVNNFLDEKNLISLYKDPNSKGIYTYDNIPPDRIIRKIELN